MEGPLVLFWVSKVAAKYSVFLVESRALALAVLAVQVCCREAFLQFLLSPRALRCSGLRLASANSNYACVTRRRTMASRASGLCKTLASKLGTRMQPFEYRSVRYCSKEINGTLTGAQKN